MTQKQTTSNEWFQYIINVKQTAKQHHITTSFVNYCIQNIVDYIQTVFKTYSITLYGV